jgi:predicted kinase
MITAIVAAALGLLIGTACLVIPRVVARRNDPYNDADALAYENETGRSAREIEQDNAAVRVRQQNRSQQGRGSGDEHHKAPGQDGALPGT